MRVDRLIEKKIFVKRITIAIFDSIRKAGRMKIALLSKWGAGLRIVAAGIVFFTGGHAFSQIELALTVEPVRALLYEPIRATVVIRNNTGGVLAFNAGQDSPRFSFEVERNKNETFKPTDLSPLLFGLKLVPSGVTTNAFDLTSLYTMQLRGLYKVRACLEWRNILFVSPAIELEMLKGFEIARVIAGVPGEQAAMRVYILEYLTRESGEHLYLRIEDDHSKKIYGVHKLGHIVRVRQPEMKIDEAGNVHVLFQSMSMVFVHAAFTPYGIQLFLKNYADKSNAIRLHNLPNGQISASQSPAIEQKAVVDGQLPQESSSTQPAAPVKARLGRGGLFGPK